MKLFAHRGVMAHRPENTMSAFELALESGADGIETDVHLTKDGELILIHDETVKRTTDGTGWVGSYTLQELKQLNAGKQFSINEPIPTLNELLNLVKNEAVVLNLEVKTDVKRYEGIELRILELIQSSEIDPARILFSSFNHVTVHRLKQMRPDIEVGVILAQPLYNPIQYVTSVGADAVHPNINRISDDEIKLFQQHDIAVRPYTVKTTGQLKRCRKLEVDGIFVNDIEWAQKTL